MKDTLFIQFYSKVENIKNRFELGNGFSDTYDICKNKGDFIWLEHKMVNRDLENYGYSSDFIIDKGTVYVSASYTSQLYQIYLWALENENINFRVGGPSISSNAFVLEEALPKNITLINNSVEEYFGIPNFSQEWKLEVPSDIPNDKIIIFSYTLENKCYWHRCKFCTFSRYRKDMVYRRRKIINYEFKDINYNGKKEVRIGSDAIIPSDIKEFISNAPSFNGLKEYRSFMRATKKELDALRKTKNLTKVRFTLGLEFPSERMWRNVDKGYNRQDVLDTINFLSDKKSHLVLGIIIGWNNLIKEDIVELRSFMDQLSLPSDTALVLHNLFIYPNTDLYKLYEKHEEFRVGPFYTGFYPKLDSEQSKLNEEAKQIVVDWGSDRNLIIILK